MKLDVLGCSGGLAKAIVPADHDIPIDGGMGDLSLAELARIDHVFITYTHLGQYPDGG